MIFIRISLTAIHLIFVGIAGMGPLLALGWSLAHRKNLDTTSLDIVRPLTRISLVSLILGIASGIGLFGLSLVDRLAWLGHRANVSPLGNEYLSENLSEVILESNAIRFWGELGFSLFCLIVATTLLSFLKSRTIWIRVFLFVAGTNLIYHFPVLFVMIAQITFQEGGHQHFSRELYRDLLGSWNIWSVVLHHWGAMFISAAICLLMIGLRINKLQARELNQSTDAKLSFTPPITTGAAMILLGITWQLLSGTFALLQMNDLRQSQFLGENINCTALLVAGVLTALSALPLLLDLSMNSHELSLKKARRKVLMIHALIGCTWFFMTGAVILGRAKS